MQSLTSCECTICPECFAQHFTIAVKEKHITDLVCPACDAPDLSDEAELLGYFSTLDIQLRECLDPETYELFSKKLTERELMRDPKFQWCTHVSGRGPRAGAGPSQNSGVCWGCGGWELCCGVVRGCQMWVWVGCGAVGLWGMGLCCRIVGGVLRGCCCSWVLAGDGGCVLDWFLGGLSGVVGGCRGTRGCACCVAVSLLCPLEMPSGPSCSVRQSLHGHHPAICLFYGRGGIGGELEVLGGHMGWVSGRAGGRGAGGRGHVSWEVLGDAGGRGGRWGSEGQTLTPRAHYKEYLVSLINARALDPARLYSLPELETVYQRHQGALPPRPPGEPEDSYRGRLLQVPAHGRAAWGSNTGPQGNRRG
uniref:RNF31 C-terminal domain-containing protein n=1 Tax=Chelonoidis abingdonii TaxID=106734 RepID=A0A8C0GCN2_CHEAB